MPFVSDFAFVCRLKVDSFSKDSLILKRSGLANVTVVARSNYQLVKGVIHAYCNIY